MSCDGNRHKYFEKAAGHKAVQDTFGSAAEAQAALEQVFQIARAKAVTGDRGQMTQAEARTRKLFAEMRSVDLKPPTHSANGLPKRDAQFGYAAVQQTLGICAQRKTHADACAPGARKNKTHPPAQRGETGCGRIYALRQLRTLRIAERRPRMSCHRDNRDSWETSPTQIGDQRIRIWRRLAGNIGSGPQQRIGRHAPWPHR